jgi:hypothetical protein
VSSHCRSHICNYRATNRGIFSSVCPKNEMSSVLRV